MIVRDFYQERPDQEYSGLFGDKFPALFMKIIFPEPGKPPQRPTLPAWAELLSKHGLLEEEEQDHPEDCLAATLHVWKTIGYSETEYRELLEFLEQLHKNPQYSYDAAGLTILAGFARKELGQLKTPELADEINSAIDGLIEFDNRGLAATLLGVFFAQQSDEEWQNVLKYDRQEDGNDFEWRLDKFKREDVRDVFIERYLERVFGKNKNG